MYDALPRESRLYEQIARNKRASLELLANVVALWLLLGLLIGFAITQTAAGGLDLLVCFGVMAVVFGLLAYYRGASRCTSAGPARSPTTKRRSCGTSSRS